MYMKKLATFLWFRREEWYVQYAEQGTTAFSFRRSFLFLPVCLWWI